MPEPTFSFDVPPDWEDPEGLHDLFERLRELRPSADIRAIRKAYFFAEQAHRSQTRESGVPYITHPVAVARILADLHMDDPTIIAALLHDTVEDCNQVNLELVQEHFGAEVARLVDGVTKLKSKSIEAQSDGQKAAADTTAAAESLRKMLLAMAKDFRVMVIKLADRLHNMQTLGSLRPEKRTRIANETLNVYAPLAARLGIWQIKWQLEDLAFKNLHPNEFDRMTELVGRTRREREEALQKIIVEIKDLCLKNGIKADVRGRPKNLYSIFNKMVKSNFRFEDILDLLAVRVIVDTVAQCYLTLGIVHQLFPPIQSLFGDYIAKPKPNGYRSIHTKVLGPDGNPIEVQIRTREMHEVAEFGVAAHWSYKEGNEAPAEESERFRVLREQLFDWTAENNSSDFLRSLSTDLFAEQVFVFTPKGDVFDLPAGSTVVDYAFRVHTDIGLQLIGAKVNGVIVPLNTQIKNGDIIECETRKNAQPSLDWLKFVRSQHARNKIRAHFRKINRVDDAVRGRALLEKELRSLGLDPKKFLGEAKLQALTKSMHGVSGAEELLSHLGAGLISVQGVINKMRGIQPGTQPASGILVRTTREGKSALTTNDNILVSRAKCCSPIPGDEVVGYVTRGRGIMIHRRICPNAQHSMEAEPGRMLPYSWPADGSLYAVNLKIVTVNRQGLLMDISAVFGEMKANVSAAKIQTMPNHTAEIEVTIDVADTDQLQLVMTKISNYSDVISLLRLFGRAAAR
jgi:GTP pyrophosphokinase